MPKWEYAAIVCDGTERITLESGNSRDFTRWVLVKPGEEPYTIRTRKTDGRRYINDSGYSWTKPSDYAIHKSYHEERGYEINNSGPQVLFLAHDILLLVNIAGAHGWEITGGLGLADGSPGNHETKWRIMRREL